LIALQDRVFVEECSPAWSAPEYASGEEGPFRPNRRRPSPTSSSGQVLPVLTPLALDPSHPFPHLRNKSLNLAIPSRRGPEARLAYGVVPVPSLLPRLVWIPGGAVLLEDVIARHLAPLFPTCPSRGAGRSA